VAGIVLPKADDADDIQAVAKALKDVESKHNMQEGTLSILPLIETCLGLRNGFDIAKASTRVIGMALASAEQGDFMVDLGGRWTPRSLALAYPRSKLACSGWSMVFL
jgi:citrate lyase subunit beta/citryl-CoA lyase